MKDSHSVVNNLLRRKNPQRIAVFDYFWADTLKAGFSQGYPADKDGNPVAPEDVFDLDLAFSGGWFDILPLPNVKEIVEESDEWVIHKNGAGASLRYWKNKSGCPEHINFEMTSRAIWEKKYRGHLLQVDKKRLDIKGSREMLKKRSEQGFWTYYGNLFVWENMRQSMGDLCLYESMLSDPAWIHDYNRVYTDFFKAHYRVMFEEVGMPDGIWMYEDLGYKNGTFCSPKTCQEILFPYYKELVDFFHVYNLPVVLHSCGNIEEILDQIVAVGFDALNPMEAKAGCDVVRFAKKYSNRLAFIGGMDVRIFESGDRTAIKDEILRIIRELKSIGAFYIFGSDHSISSKVRYDDYRYAIDLVREHGNY
jgi:uroporphyrinogen decarboxylase